jgi:hypothetical protein
LPGLPGASQERSSRLGSPSYASLPRPDHRRARLHRIALHRIVDRAWCPVVAPPRCASRGLASSPPGPSLPSRISAFPRSRWAFLWPRQPRSRFRQRLSRRACFRLRRTVKEVAEPLEHTPSFSLFPVTSTSVRGLAVSHRRLPDQLSFISTEKTFSGVG